MSLGNSSFRTSLSSTLGVCSLAAIFSTWNTECREWLNKHTQIYYCPPITCSCVFGPAEGTPLHSRHLPPCDHFTLKAGPTTVWTSEAPCECDPGHSPHSAPVCTCLTVTLWDSMDEQLGAFTGLHMDRKLVIFCCLLLCSRTSGGSHSSCSQIVCVCVCSCPCRGPEQLHTHADH